MVHVVRLIKSGNSYVVTLPAPVREAMHLGRGDQLVVSVECGRLIMVKVEGALMSNLTDAVEKAKP